MRRKTRNMKQLQDGADQSFMQSEFENRFTGRSWECFHNRVRSHSILAFPIQQ